ncbi:hypothetical protein [Demequina sp. NBRC 110056]|uniref:hypothetical protein n=1 Tax=Demequina sp. NBRC 110056 TaxID=1570345 RepID=UPI0009FC2C21|nr:hypothetical protein [Demequina sp. NBRC 110056]
MSAPSIRTVAVAAGFLGVSMIVAGAATAMTVDTPDEPIANAVTVETPAADVAAAVPAEPVEVGLEPIECTDDGSCGPKPAAAAPAEQTSAQAPKDEPATPVAKVAAAEPEVECTLPERPTKPSDGDWEGWKSQLHAWFDDVKAAAEACDLDRSEWRALLGESAWKDFESCRKDRESGEWSRSDTSERATSDDERGWWSKDRDESRDRSVERSRDGRGDGDRSGDRDRWRDRDGWGDGDRGTRAESGDRRR